MQVKLRKLASVKRQSFNFSRIYVSAHSSGSGVSERLFAADDVHRGGYARHGHGQIYGQLLADIQIDILNLRRQSSRLGDYPIAGRLQRGN